MTGRVALMVVPWPGRERTCKLPPAISSCWRMLASPKWLRPRWSPMGSAEWVVAKPVPSSSTWSVTWPWRRCRATRACLALACLATLVRASWGDPVQHRLLCSGQPLGQAGLDTASDPRLLLEGLGVVAEGLRQPPFVQGRGSQLHHHPPERADLAADVVLQ